MKLTRNNLTIGILLFLLIVNLLVIFNLNYFYIQAILAFIFLITIPGLLIMLMFKIREVGFWEYLVYTIGLSIAFLMFAGLLVNWTLPFLGIDKPLSLKPLLISFDIFLLIFLLIAYKRNEEISLEIKSPKFDWLNQLFFIIPMIFPALSILGALTLNNNGPNHLTMIMLGGIAVYVFFAVLFRNKLNKNVYPFAILMISISLLLMGWLRSWYVSGVDINLEYSIFQLTKETQYWTMLNFNHAYNACLSVSLLPTIFSYFLGINDQYIFKLIIPLIFSITPLIIYLISKRYGEEIFAFLTAFFFVSQPTFITWLWIPTRQEIAFLFFALSLAVLFNKNINSVFKKFLFLVFAFSMVVSHYTTTYIALPIFVLVYLICLVFRKTENKKPFSEIYEKLNLKEKGEAKERKYYLSATLIVLLLIFSFLWYSQLTEISAGLSNSIKKSFSNIKQIFSEDVQAEGQSPLNQFNIFLKPKNIYLTLRNYTEEINKTYKQKYPSSVFYSPETYKDYSVQPRVSEGLPYKFNAEIVSIIFSLRELLKVLGKVFIIIGVFYLLFQLKEFKKDIEYLMIILASFLILSLIIILPFSSISYDLVRTYQQILITLSLPAILGSLFLFGFLKKNFRIIITTIFFLLYFLFLSRFTQQIIGGYDISMRFNNIGQEYDVYYTHKAEIISGEWLFNNYNKKDFVYADTRALSKIVLSTPPAFMDKIINDILPSIIRKNDYVYLSHANLLENITFKTLKGDFFSYNFPTEFLNQNKNKIYNNRGSEIFK